MRYLGWLILPLLLSQTGCDTSFPGEEMDVTGSAKTRPFAVVCEPAEAAPGDTVQVTLHYYEPDPEHHDVGWRVALDYDIGLYEADEVERDIVALEAVDPPTWDAHGFCTQSFSYVLPEDVMLRASAQPEILTDPLVVEPARILLELAPDAPVSKAALDAELQGMGWYGVHWYWNHTAEQAAAARWLGDVFATRIRFRASLDATVPVDVTRNLTVRYARRFETMNTNTAPTIVSLRLEWLEASDVLYEDFENHDPDLSHVATLATADSVATDVEIPVDPGWSYYLVARLQLQDYTSPFSEQIHEERYDMSWYHARLDGAVPVDVFYATDDGDEAEMEEIDGRIVRVLPPVAGTTLRLVVCARDHRIEWEGYGYEPAASLVSCDVSFVAP